MCGEYRNPMSQKSRLVLQLSKSPMQTDEMIGDQALSNPNTPTDKAKPADKLVGYLNVGYNYR